MEISYENKKDKEQILKAASDFNINIEFDPCKPLLIFGDNFKGLPLLKNYYTNKIDLIYIDPPFNTNQDFYISSNRANSISRQNNAVLAYSDKMSKEDYLEFIRERLVLLHELLSEKGSIYFHIDYKIGHYIKIIMDEIFGEKNYKNDITRIKSNPKNFYRRAYGNEKDMVLFYSKTNENIWNDVKIPLSNSEISKKFSKIDADGRRYTTVPLHAPGETKSGNTGKPWGNIEVPEGRHWRTDPSEFDLLNSQGKIEWSSTGNPRIKKYAEDHKGKKIQDVWVFKDPQEPRYPTEKNSKMLKQIILQSSAEDSIVLDCFAGSGSTLKCAYDLNRQWIGIDNSKEAINVIKNRNLGTYQFINLKKNKVEIINR